MKFIVLVCLVAYVFSLSPRFLLTWDRVNQYSQYGIPATYDQQNRGPVYGLSQQDFVNDPRYYQPYTLKQLQNGLPPGVQWDKKEAYLSDEEFESLFYMTKQNFYSLPKDQQDILRKRFNLYGLSKP